MEEWKPENLLPIIKAKPNGTMLTGNFKIRYMGIPRASISLDKRDIVEDFGEIFIVNENGNCTALHCAIIAKGLSKVKIAIEDVIEVFDYEESEKIKS